MVYIVITHWYPTHIAREVTNKFLESLPKWQVDDSILVQRAQAVKATKKGIKVITTHLVKPGKLEEDLAKLVEFQGNFIDINGLEYSIEVLWTVPEALAAIGMKFPGQ